MSKIKNYSFKINYLKMSLSIIFILFNVNWPCLKDVYIYIIHLADAFIQSNLKNWNKSNLSKRQQYL